MSALKYFFGVVARPQTWLDYVYLWLAFPLGLFYFVFLVVGLSVGLSLVIVWVGIPMLLLVAGAWYLFAGLERVLARELLRVPVAPAPRAWEAADGVWNKLKAHFASASTWKDLVHLLARLPLGIVAFTIVMTQAGLAVSFIGAPLFQRFDALWIGGQRIESFGVALALVPVGVLLVIALFHVVHGWAWVCGKLATALFGQPGATPATTPAGLHDGAAQPPQAPPYPQTQAPQYPQTQAPPYPQQAPPPRWTAGPPPQLPPGLKYPAGTPWPQPLQGTQGAQGAEGAWSPPAGSRALDEPTAPTAASWPTPITDAPATVTPSADTPSAADAAADPAPASEAPAPDPHAPEAPAPDPHAPEAPAPDAPARPQ